MKKHLPRIPIMVILVGFFLTAVVGCKKENKDDDPAASGKEYRIASVRETESGVTYETRFGYNSDNKIVGMNGYMNEMPVSKGICTYTGNEAKLSVSYYNGSQWNEYPYYVILSYTGNHLTEIRTYDSDNLNYRVTYTWDGDKVTEETSEFVTYGEVNGTSRVRYIYSGAQMTTVEYLSGNHVSQKLTIEYADGKPVALKAFSGNNEMYEYTEMIYTGTNMTKINEHFISNGTSTGIRCSEDRTFASNNKVIGITTSCTDSEPYTSSLEWQEGTGNSNDLVLAYYGWLTLYLFPDTFTSDMLVQLKSTKNSLL